jgi:hypothetical protein
VRPNQDAGLVQVAGGVRPADRIVVWPCSSQRWDGFRQRKKGRSQEGEPISGARSSALDGNSAAGLTSRVRRVRRD